MLAIHPTDPERYYPELEVCLERIGLIAEPWRQRCFLVGDGLMRHIGLVGCMPSLKIRPDGKSGFCYIELPEVTDAPGFRFARARPPRCPACRQAIGWPDLSGDGMQCRCCDRRFPLPALRWPVRSAGLARQWLLIHELQRGDGAPTEAFLDLLERETGLPWDYCFPD